MSEHLVELHVYDLSKGLARHLSYAVIGTHIEGVWHSSIVAWGKEIYFGQGIRIVEPGSTHFGKPTKVHQLGTTSMDFDTFMEILEEMRPRFRPQDYNLLQHNCNTFSSEVAQILTGADIPSYVTTNAQTAALRNSSLGQSIIGQLSNGITGTSPLSALLGRMQAAATESDRPNNIDNAQQSNAGANIMTQPMRSSAMTTPSVPKRDTSASTVPAAPAPAPASNIIAVSDAAHLKKVIDEYPALVVLFTSPTCPPCRVVEPVYEELANGDLPATFARVTAGSSGASSAMASAGVAGTPTVHVYTFGKQTAKVVGANIPEIRMQAQIASADAYPAHPHTTVQLSSGGYIPTEPSTSAVVPRVDALTAKIKEIYKSIGTEAAFEAYAVLANDMIPWLVNTKRALAQPHKAVWDASVRTFLNSNVELPTLFPVYDVLRLSALYGGVSQETINLAIDRAAEMLPDSNVEETRALWLTALRLAGNALAKGAPLLPNTVSLVTDGILVKDASVRQTASAVEALSREDHQATAVRLAAALLFFIYRSPSWADHLQPLYGVLDIDAVLGGVEICEWSVPCEDLNVSRYSADSHPLAPHNLAARGYHTFTCFEEPFHVPKKYSLVRELGYDTEGNHVAIKKVTRVFEREVLTRRALREVAILRHLEGCENVTQLIDFDTSFVEFSEIYLYLSASDADLHQIFKSGQELSEAHIRYFMVQILRAPGNLLVNSDCHLRVCDFGLARPFKYADQKTCEEQICSSSDWPPESSGNILTPSVHPTPSMPRAAECQESVSTIAIPHTHSMETDSTPSDPSRAGWPARDGGRAASHERVVYPGGPLTEYVSTRWYRAPEVMLCFRDGYGPPMDMWSVGCIFAELLAGKPLCAGKDFMDQLVRIHNLLGTAPPSVVDRIGSNRAKIHVQLLPPSTGVTWSKLFPHIPPEALDLLSRLLRWDPEERITAREALMHPWLRGYRTKSLSQPCPPPFSRFGEIELIRTPSEFARALEKESMLLHRDDFDSSSFSTEATTPEGTAHEAMTPESIVQEAMNEVHNRGSDSESEECSAAAAEQPVHCAQDTLKRKASDNTFFGRARQLMGWI
ncbi:hypothetical protein MCUN1_002313 [Malassezia cuniculi]|uniref:Non-specific serine/threonine protein kinase n=1 Tax=Malassezia cuniculi TaxID=948313 RepID=A0AAF0J7A6_9BASI|nr:hypothetical protein MCUN1_002313 [Malassezia cuniculi]